MLIDQLLGDPILAKAEMLAPDLRGRLAKATKFVLRRDFAMAADEFSSDIANINKVLGFARLPYPECWFEVAQNDRKLFAEAGMEETDRRCQRVGFLAAAGDDPAQLRAHFVRGHFKVRRTGVFFWSAYQRGNPALGFVHKDYALSGAGVLQ
jgi:hypothetical protein